MLEKVTEYFEEQYLDTKRAIDENYGWNTPSEFVNRAITNCLAVTMFVQSLGVKYKEVAPLYEEIKARLENLLK